MSFMAGVISDTSGIFWGVCPLDWTPVASAMAVDDADDSAVVVSPGVVVLASPVGDSVSPSSSYPPSTSSS